MIEKRWVGDRYFNSGDTENYIALAAKISHFWEV
jgi:hypothetical protein